MAIIERTKLDGGYIRERLRPENTNELQQMQQNRPPKLPATHVWEYVWIDPTPEELARNPRLMPVEERGPRELSLIEIAAKSKDFETLTHGELRWLFDKHKVVALPATKDNPKPDELQSLKDSLRAHVKKHPPTAQSKKAVQANMGEVKGWTTTPIAISDDIAGMSKADIKTQAGVNGWLDEFAKQPQDLPSLRAWLSERRAAKKVEPEPAMA